jgi:hypothetical protein
VYILSYILRFNLMIDDVRLHNPAQQGLSHTHTHTHTHSHTMELGGVYGMRCVRLIPAHTPDLLTGILCSCLFPYKMCVECKYSTFLGYKHNTHLCREARLVSIHRYKVCSFSTVHILYGLRIQAQHTPV